MTPEQLASKRLFGRDDFVPSRKDVAHPDPLNLHGPRVSWNALVQQFNMCRVDESVLLVPNRLHGAAINAEGCAI